MICVRSLDISIFFGLEPFKFQAFYWMVISWLNCMNSLVFKWFTWTRNTSLCNVGNELKVWCSLVHLVAYSRQTAFECPITSTCYFFPSFWPHNHKSIQEIIDCNSTLCIHELCYVCHVMLCYVCMYLCPFYQSDSYFISKACGSQVPPHYACSFALQYMCTCVCMSLSIYT